MLSIGSSVNKKSRICKIGSERIRKALYMPAIVIILTFKSFANV
ncbi:transposase [Wolbachia endosymbiont of Armadillidium arcangelii]